MGCILAKNEKAKKQQVSSKKSVTDKESIKSEELSLNFESETSEDEEKIMIKEIELGKHGFLRTFMSILGESTVAEWHIVSKTKVNLVVDVVWELYNMKFEGDNIGTEDQPKVHVVVKPLEKKVIGRVNAVDLNESIDFKIETKWTTEEADKSYLKKIADDQVKNINRRLDQKAFVDKEFPPIYESLDYSENADLSRAIEFKPINEIFETPPKIFDSTIFPNDIVMGTDYLIFSSALALLAEMPNFVKRLFITQTLNKNGKYILRLFVDGKWKAFFIDQFLPSHLNTKELAFTKHKRDNLWVPFLEKLVAKILGDYERVKKATFLELAENFTGCPVNEVHITHSHTVKFVFDILRKTDMEKCLLFGYFAHDKNMTLKNGLVTNFAYAVLEAVELDEVILIQLRNFAFEKHKWKGDWDEQSSLWTDEIKSQVNFDFSQGKFWMEFKDFVKTFNTLGICHRKEMGSVQTEIEVQNDNTIPFLSLKVPKGVKTKFLSLFQKWASVRGNPAYIDVGAIVIDILKDEVISLIPSTAQRSFHTNCVLGEGEYLVLPFSSGVIFDAKEEAETDSPRKIFFTAFQKQGIPVSVEVIPHDKMRFWVWFNAAAKYKVANSGAERDVQRFSESSEYEVFHVKLGLMHIAGLVIKAPLIGKNVAFTIDCSQNIKFSPAEDSFVKLEKKVFEMVPDKEDFTVIAKFIEKKSNEGSFSCTVEMSWSD